MKMISLLTFLSLGSLGATAYAQDQAVDLGTLGGNSSHALDINASGQVVGTSGTSTGEVHGFLWENGTMKDLGKGDARSINASGTVVMNRVVAFDVEAGNIKIESFLSKDGQETILPALPGHKITEAVGINDLGQVVGSSNDNAVVWSELGVPTALPTLGGTSLARAINNKGWIVGSSMAADGKAHAVLWRDGQIIDLGNIGTGRAVAHAINDAGQIAGEASGHAFIWQDGVMRSLATNGTAAKAFDINSAGVLAGQGDHWARQYPIVWGANDFVVKELALFDGALWADAAGINENSWVVGSTTYGVPSDIHPPTSVRATLWK